MKKSKRFLSAMLTVILISQCIIISASAATTNAELDNRYWAIQAEYGEAMQNKDNKGIIKAVQKAYDLFVGSADPAKTADKWLKNKDLELNIITTYILEAGKAAEVLGEIDEMKKWYNLYLIFIDRQKMLWTEAQRLDVDTFKIPEIKTKLAAYTVEPIFFTELPPDNSTNPYTGAKHEPRNGIYYGTTNPYAIGPLKGNPTTASNSKTPSGALVYVEFKQEKINDFDWMLKELIKKTDIIEVAWNVNPSYISLKDAAKETKLIEDTADYLAELGTPVLLRAAAEMNVWNPPANADDFKKFFKTVADIMHERAPNVAMLFSPNEGSALGVTIMDYYPGDKYVDWVGISHYYQYFFLGQRNAPDIDRAKYMTAEYASPIRKLENIVSLFGGKKPIMLSEYGVANYSNNLKESTVDWAKYKLTQLQYYAPMFYPEIKAMFYFDVDRTRAGEANNYALNNSPVMNELYNKLMRNNGIYLPMGKDTSEFIYAKIDAGGRIVKSNSVIINTYAEVLHFPDLTVTYSVGGKQYAKSTEIPYRGVLDLSGLKDGKHTIEVEVKTTKDNKSHAKKTIIAEKKGNNITLADASIPSSGGNRNPVPLTSTKAPAAPAGPPKVGDPIGNVLYSDISAYINGYEIPTSVIKGKTLVTVEDLSNYGFDVVWNGQEKSLKVERNKDKIIKPLTVKRENKPVGTLKEKYLLTDVKTYLSGTQVESFAVAGKTLIDFDFLKKYGTMGWNDKTRSLTLWLD